MFSYRESMLRLKVQIEECTIPKDRRRLKRRRSLYLSQRGRCCFCNTKMFACSLLSTKTQMATVEHVIPKCQGGKELKMSCNRCNQNRRVIDFDFFKFVVDNTKYAEMPVVARSSKKLNEFKQKYDLLFSQN